MEHAGHAPGQLFPVLGVKRRAHRAEHPQRRHVRRSEPRRAEQRDDLRRDHEHVGHPFARDRVDDGLGIEVVMQDESRSQHEGRHQGEEAAVEAERARMQRDALRPHPPGQAKEDPVEAADPLREDDPLRQPGRAAAVDDVVGVIAAHADRGRRVLGRVHESAIRAVTRAGVAVDEQRAVRAEGLDFGSHLVEERRRGLLGHDKSDVGVAKERRQALPSEERGERHDDRADLGGGPVDLEQLQ